MKSNICWKMQRSANYSALLKYESTSFWPTIVIIMGFDDNKNSINYQSYPSKWCLHTNLLVIIIQYNIV